MDIKVNETPIRTSRNFRINNIKIDDIEIPENIEKFKNVEIVSQNCIIDSKIDNKKLVYGNGEILEENVNKFSNNVLKLTTTKNKQDIKIISNLPYYITTQILSKILFSNYSIHSLIVMMQKEVGMKLYRPQLKEKSPLTTILQYQYQVDIIQHVSKNAYLPRPEIDSMVLKIKKRMPTIQAKDEKILFDIIKELFKNRRKTIANNLQSYFKKKEDVLTFLKDLSIAENKRIEQLSLSEIILIADHLGE